MMTKG